eukprot:scaffold97763_cov33-Tisochrysis_lutea.AAC.2
MQIDRRWRALWRNRYALICCAQRVQGEAAHYAATMRRASRARVRAPSCTLFCARVYRSVLVRSGDGRAWEGKDVRACEVDLVGSGNPVARRPTRAPPWRRPAHTWRLLLSAGIRAARAHRHAPSALHCTYCPVALHEGDEGAHAVAGGAALFVIPYRAGNVQVRPWGFLDKLLEEERGRNGAALQARRECGWLVVSTIGTRLSGRELSGQARRLRGAASSRTAAARR